MSYYSNDVITITGTFTDADGVATAPTDLSLVIRPDAGTATTVALASLTTPSTGVYTYDWTAPSVTGPTMYLVQWQPTGAVQRATEPDAIYVKPLLA